MSGSFTNKFKNRMEQEKDKDKSKDKLADKFNETASLLIDEFLNEVNANNIRLDDTADLMRLFQIYSEINNIKDAATEGAGSLPGLSQRQSKQIKSYVETEEVETSNGEYEDVIDTESLMKLSEDEVSDMIKEREIEMNADNAQEWEEGNIG